MKLTIKQEKFAFNLFQGMTQSEAYTKAGYTCKAITTTNSAASRLAKDVNIQNRLHELQAKQESSKIMGVQERREMLTLIARFGGKLSIPAIAELNKMGGDYAPTRQDITTKGEALKGTTIFNIVNPQTKDLLSRLENGEREPKQLESNTDIPSEPIGLPIGQTNNSQWGRLL